MDDQLKKELRKYLFFSPGDYTFYIFCFVLTVALLVIGISGGGGRFAMGLILAVLFNLPMILDYSRFKSTMEKYEKSNKMDLVLLDFRVGKFLCNDALCMGENVMIGRYTGNVFTYDEIDKVYQKITKTNGAVSKNELRVQLKDNSVKTLARLKAKHENVDEMHLAIQIMLSKNPNIQVGYK